MKDFMKEISHETGLEIEVDFWGLSWWRREDSRYRGHNK